MAALARGHALPAGGWERPVRWLPGGTCSLYLVHYPALQSFDAALPEHIPAVLRYGALLISVVVTAFLFAELFERRLSAQRALLRGIGSKAAAWLPQRRPARPEAQFAVRPKGHTLPT